MVVLVRTLLMEDLAMTLLMEEMIMIHSTGTKGMIVLMEVLEMTLLMEEMVMILSFLVPQQIKLILE